MTTENQKPTDQRRDSDVESPDLLAELKRIRREIVDLEMRMEMPESARSDMRRAREALHSAGITYQFDAANVKAHVSPPSKDSQ